MSGEFLHTIGSVDQLPDLFKGSFLKGRPEPRIAMVGRSNVGKSTLINALIGTRLAQTSAEPGKTRKLHLYLWKEAKRVVVDLPGYGFAKAGHADREDWANFIQAYFHADGGLELALVLLDARHGPTELDLQAIGYLIDQGIPLRFVFTKADAIKGQSERASRKKEAAVALTKLGANPDEAFWVSAKDKDLGLKKLSDWVSQARK